MLDAIRGLFGFGPSVSSDLAAQGTDAANSVLDSMYGYNNTLEQNPLGLNQVTNTNYVSAPTGSFTPSGSGLGLAGWGNVLSGIGMGLQGLSGLAGAYMGYKNYQLAQDQFNFQKGLANRNLANQAKMINNTYDNAAQVAAGMIGGTDRNGNYGFTRQSTVDRYTENAKRKHVDGSPIG